MRPQVTVGVSTTNKFMSKVIRFITRSPCSHAWISFYDMTLDMRLVMQAELWGFEVRPWNRWKQENILVGEFKILHKEDSDLYTGVRYLATKLGTDYDFKSALFVGIKKWFTRWFKSGCSLNLDRSPNKLMCSEAVTDYLKYLKLSSVESLDTETTAPGDLYTIYKHSHEFLEIGRQL